MKNLLLSIAIFLCLESCENHKSKKIDETLKELSQNKGINVGNLNYKFDLPDGWQKHDTIIHSLYLCFLFTNDSVYNPIINIATEHMKGVSHDNYFRAVKESFKDYATDVEFMDEGHFNVFNNDCLWFVQTNTNSFDGVRREKIFYSIEIDGISYNISGACNPTGLKKYRQVFNRIVQSFRLV